MSSLDRKIGPGRFAAITACLATLGSVFLPQVAWAQTNSSGAPASGAAVLPVQNEEARAAARPLASEGVALYQAGLYADALDRLLKADALYPTPQYRVYIARVYAKLGKFVSAARAYETALALPLPPSTSQGFRDAQAAALVEIQEVSKRVATVQIVVAGPSVEAVRVTIDGVAVAAGDLEKNELDPGAHTVMVAAAGFDSLERAIELQEGGTERLEMTLQKASPQARSGAAVSAPVSQHSPTKRRSSHSSLPSERESVQQVNSPFPSDHEGDATLSHRGQLGAFARGDIDPLYKGLALAVGASYGLIDRLEVGAAALVGRNKGLEPDLTFFVLTGPWKPFVNAGVPIFFMDGAYVGVRGAAGLQWDPIRRIGVFVQVGGAYFGSQQEGYAKGLFMPSVGLQARL